MNDKTNAKLKIYMSGGFSALILTVALAYWFGAFSADNISLAFAALSNACFTTAVLYIGFGALIWISKTGIFDIFGFGFKSLKYLFTPMKKDPAEGGYYEYVMEKREKRKNKPVPYYVLIIGLIAFALAAVFLALWSVTGSANVL